MPNNRINPKLKSESDGLFVTPSRWPHCGQYFATESGRNPQDAHFVADGKLVIDLGYLKRRLRPASEQRYSQYQLRFGQLTQY